MYIKRKLMEQDGNIRAAASKTEMSPLPTETCGRKEHPSLSKAPLW